MASETPRIDPTEISNINAPVFRIIAQIKSQPTESQLVLQSPTMSSTDGGEIEMITLNNIRVSMNKTFEVDSWYEFVCRNNDDGELGFLILDAVLCKFKENEELSLHGAVALQRLCKKYPEIY
ncbi:hypothetical protein SUVZ_10G0340 [Saccharomyces uvarum]|uniref:Replication factor A protein 3 n=1 Tax=Saccharomyces uvarum TaxID=230603 RepID=A0ABN8WIM7_SACUV|nr:hypothetical protein SUVZ_10G0340 [Saccharomyces uvarum]